MRKSLRMLWLPGLVLAVFATGCAQTCPPMRHGALGQACMGGPQWCAAHAGCDQMQAGCASMKPGSGQRAAGCKGMAGCASMGPGGGQQAACCKGMAPGGPQGMAGCASMGPGGGQQAACCKGMAPGGPQGMAGCASMKPGCGQGMAGCASMGAGCGQPGAGMQAYGPRASGSVVAPSEWGPKPSLDDYLRGCCLMGGRGPGPRAACGPSCKYGSASMGCGTGAGMNTGQPCCGSAPANRQMRAMPGGAGRPSVTRRGATTQ